MHTGNLLAKSANLQSCAALSGDGPFFSVKGMITRVEASHVAVTTVQLGASRQRDCLPDCD